MASVRLNSFDPFEEERLKPMRDLIRPTIAVLVAPLFAAALIAVLDWLLSGKPPDGTYASAFVVFAYLFATAPAAITILVLRKLNWRRLWHFLMAGVLVAFVCTSVFVWSVYAGSIDSIVDWVRYSMRFLPFLLIGALTGGVVWLLSEYSPSDARR